jgi:cyclase
MASEAFIPLSYGGNIDNLTQVKEIINLGFEKVVLNSLFHKNINEVIKITNELGSQSVVLKIDYVFVKNHFQFFSMGKVLNIISFDDLMYKIKLSNVGELILSRVDFDGAMSQFDISEFSKYVLNNLNIPVVLSNGAKDKYSINEPLKLGFNNFTASSCYVFVGNLNGILINNPFES